MGPHDGRVDHLDAVLALTALIERRQHHVPHARPRPAPELPVGRTPLAEMVVQIAPGRARRVWEMVNLPNLRQHIARALPTADLVVRKGADHGIVRVQKFDV